MQAHMPAIEIPFGETFRAASHAVAACAHLRLRVAIGRRSIVVLGVAGIKWCTQAIPSQPDHGQDKLQRFARASSLMRDATLYEMRVLNGSPPALSTTRSLGFG
jgi:hypothetical protein